MGLTDIANKLGLKTIATNELPLPSPLKDARAQDLMLCIGTGSLMDDENRMRFANDQFYMKTEEEMREALRDFPRRAIPRWRLLRNAMLSWSAIPLPRFPLPPGYTEETLFRNECEDGLKRRYGDPFRKTHGIAICTRRALLFSRASLHTSSLSRNTFVGREKMVLP